MSGRPLVSIVTPTLNQGAFIDATINSIKAQTYLDYEHIVIDGGSTDGTLDILRAHEGTYPMRWQSEPDRGMYDAINKGLRQARGEILCYLNSDDLYFPWTLEVVVAHFRRHPETDFVFGDALSIEDETGRVDVTWTPPFNVDLLRRFEVLVQPTVFWRRSAYACEGDFDTSLRYVADCDYWMRAGDHHRFAKINEFLAVERTHAGTLHARDAHGLTAELASVRSRYVRSQQTRQHLQRTRHAIRSKAWSRVSWAVMAVQSVLTPSLRVRWWARLVGDPRSGIRVRHLAGILVPRYGRRVFHRALEPGRAWLEPPAQ